MNPAINITKTLLIFLALFGFSLAISFEPPTPLNNSNLSQNFIEVNVSENLSNLTKIEIFLFDQNNSMLLNFSCFETNITNTSPCFTNFSNLSDGIYRFNATSTDILNNTNTTETREITINTTIVSPQAHPFIQFVLPTPANNTAIIDSNFSVNLSVADADSLNGTITLDLFDPNATLINSKTGSFFELFEVFTNLTPGNYTYNATAVDSANLSNSTEIRTIEILSLVLDFPPTILFEHPTPNDSAILNESNFTINVTATDDLNLTTIEIELFDENGTLIENRLCIFSTCIEQFNLSNANYSFNATATDNSSQKITTQTRNIEINTMAQPQPLAELPIQFIDPTPVNNSTINTSSLEVGVSANSSNPDKLRVFLYDSNGTLLNETITDYTNNTSVFVVFTNLSDGAYFINATANDTSANQNSTETRQITISTTIIPPIPVIPPACQCDSKTSCMEKLNGQLCPIVLLNTSLNVSDSFIDNPNNFTNKTFMCNGNTLHGDKSGIGIYLKEKENNSIQNCIIENFKLGIYLKESNFNNLTNNTIINNKEEGLTLKESSNNTINSNNISKNEDGIELKEADFNSILNNTISYNEEEGIELKESNNNSIYNNTISKNGEEGIQIKEGSGNLIYLNEVNDNEDGIELSDSESNNQIYQNKIFSNDEQGIELHESKRDSVFENIIWNNEIGVELKNSEYNNIHTNDNFNNSKVQLELKNSDKNLIYNNIFNATNGKNMLDVKNKKSENFWNTTLINTTNIIGGPFIGGNYYEKDGFGMSEICSDLDLNGFCDAPFIINSKNVDFLPLTT